jgi:hypothetical protein
MNSGIIRKALTTTLALELKYRDPSGAREIEADTNQPAELQSPGRVFEDQLAHLLSVI